jgi:hypothetical protein
MNKALMADEEWHKTDEYKRIKSVIDNLVKNGMVDRFRGNCIGTSDLIHNYLTDVGIDSKLVEVKLSMLFEHQNQQGFYFLGYDSILSNNNEIDTHVVVLTETSVPMIIDMSISHLLPKEKPFVFERVNMNDVSVLSTYDYGTVKLTYRTKENIRLPSLHQKTVLQRIVEDRKNKESMKFLKFMVVFSVTVTSINFIINMSLIGLNLHQIQLKHMYNQGMR